MIDFLLSIIYAIFSGIVHASEWIFSVNGSQVIHNLSVSFGAVLASVAGFKIIND